MATELQHLLPGIAALADPTRKADLAEVASLVGLSPSRAQRVIQETIGESPKRYQQRTRLELGAILLASTDARIIDVAFASGFSNHETFTRAFTAQFGESPSRWRSSRRSTLEPDHARTAASISRCMTLYHRPLTRKDPAMTYEITTKTVEAIPILYQAHKVAHEDIGGVLAQCLPAVFGYVMENGLQPAGHPFVRYAGMSAAFFEIEAGIPLVTAPETSPPAETAILSGELPAGPVAATIHKGPYEGLRDAYAALERWLEDSDVEATGAPWEVYLTDPGEVPDPADWLTEVSFPITAV